MLLRKENACYDTTEWDELQKKYGNLDTELGSDRYLKDLEEETRAIGDVLKKQEKEEETRWNQRAMEMGDEDDEADEDEQTFMENYRLRFMCVPGASEDGSLSCQAAQARRDESCSQGSQVRRSLRHLSRLLPTGQRCHHVYSSQHGCRRK